MVAQPGSIKASKRFEAKAYLLKKDEGVVISRFILIISLNFIFAQLI